MAENGRPWPIRLLALAAALAAGAGGCRADDLWRVAVDRDPAVLYAVPTCEPVVALTLDDGPHAASTPRILEVLGRHGARATFFLIGANLPGNEALVEAIVSAGHEIANHGGYDRPAVDLGPARFERDLLATHERLARFGEPRFYRPGSGWYDDWMLPIVARHGYTLALGSVYPFDVELPWPALTRSVAEWGIEPGAILVLHDAGESGPRTWEVLEGLLPELEERGLRVVSLSELVRLAAVPAARDPREGSATIEAFGERAPCPPSSRAASPPSAP